jgi:hypothetical protein
MTLSDEITLDPTGKGYANYLPDAPGVVCDLLNTPTETMAKERWVTALTILSKCELGVSIIRKLKALESQDAVVEVAWNRLNGDPGLNVNDPATRMYLDQLVREDELTAEEVAQLKALAMQPASRAEVLGLPPVTEIDLIEAGVVK